MLLELAQETKKVVPELTQETETTLPEKAFKISDILFLPPPPPARLRYCLKFFRFLIMTFPISLNNFL